MRSEVVFLRKVEANTAEAFAFGTSTASLEDKWQQPMKWRKIMLRRWIISGLVALGLIFPAVESAQAARPRVRNHYYVRSLDDYRYDYRYSPPERPIDVWGLSSYYGHWNPLNYPNIPYPDYSGGLYYGNPTFGFYGDPGYVAPYWGMDVVY
jgi:hypothetical protein